MMGRFVVVVKRWWVLALVFTLALSLTSCSKKKTSLQTGDYGFGYCDGTIGSFDVYVIPSKSNPGFYELSIIPVQLDAPGDIAKVTIASQNLSYKEVVPQVVLQNQQEIYAGLITESDLANYEILAITPWDAGTTFLEQQTDKDALCSMPLPYQSADGLGNAAQQNGSSY